MDLTPSYRISKNKQTTATGVGTEHVTCRTVCRTRCVCLQAKLDEKFDDTVAQLRNEGNWLSDTEEELLSQGPVSESEEELQHQLQQQKVTHITVSSQQPFTPSTAMSLWTIPPPPPGRIPLPWRLMLDHVLFGTCWHQQDLL